MILIFGENFQAKFLGKVSIVHIVYNCTCASIYYRCVIYRHLHWCRDWIKYHKIKNQNHVSCFNICSMSWEELFINTALRIQPFIFFLMQIEPQPPRAQNKPIKRTPTLNVFQKVRRNRTSLDISNFTIRNSVDIPQLTSPFFEPHNIRPGCKKEKGEKSL